MMRQKGFYWVRLKSRHSGSYEPHRDWMPAWFEVDGIIANWHVIGDDSPIYRDESFEQIGPRIQVPSVLTCAGCATAEALQKHGGAMIHDDAFGHCDDCGADGFQTDYQHTCNGKSQCFSCFAKSRLFPTRPAPPVG